MYIAQFDHKNQYANTGTCSKTPTFMGVCRTDEQYQLTGIGVPLEGLQQVIVNLNLSGQGFGKPDERETVIRLERTLATQSKRPRLAFQTATRSVVARAASFSTHLMPISSSKSSNHFWRQSPLPREAMPSRCMAIQRIQKRVR